MEIAHPIGLHALPFLRKVPLLTSAEHAGTHSDNKDTQACHEHKNASRGWVQSSHVCRDDHTSEPAHPPSTEFYSDLYPALVCLRLRRPESVLGDATHPPEHHSSESCSALPGRTHLAVLYALPLRHRVRQPPRPTGMTLSVLRPQKNTGSTPRPACRRIQRNPLSSSREMHSQLPLPATGTAPPKDSLQHRRCWSLSTDVMTSPSEQVQHRLKHSTRTTVAAAASLDPGRHHWARRLPCPSWHGPTQVLHLPQK